MSQRDLFLDEFDREMLPYTQSDSYKYQHAANNKLIADFRSTLSKEQCSQFNELLNCLSNEYSDFIMAAYEKGSESRSSMVKKHVDYCL